METVKNSQLREIGAGVSTLIPCERVRRAEGAQKAWTAPISTSQLSIITPAGFC